MTDVFYVNHSSIVVPDYEVGTSEKLEGSLSVWDDVRFEMKPIGMHYDEETKTLYLPRGLDVGFLERELDRKPIINREHDEGKTFSCRIKTDPRDDLQRMSISFLLGRGDFSHTASASQLALTLTTGAGKTYCTIAALSFMKKVPIIITHNNNIKAQWVSAFEEHGDVDARSICNINGSATIKRLLKMKRIPFKVFVVNRRTLKSYASKNGWESIGELFKVLGIGVKVYDEVHIEFDTILKTDFFTNTWKSIYLTATLERSNHSENRVFELCFKNVYKYGEVSKKIMKKNILYVAAKFNTKPSYMDRANMRTMKGFNVNRYGTYLMESDLFFEAVSNLMPQMIKLIEGHGGGKVAFMTSTIDSTFKMQEFFTELFPDYKVMPYNSKVSPADKQKAIEEADIITTTPKSLGTGNNIDNIRLLVNVEPYSSKVTASQVSGRLRYTRDNKASLYVEMIDEGFTETVRMFKRRLPLFKTKALKIINMEL